MNEEAPDLFEYVVSVMPQKEHLYLVSRKDNEKSKMSEVVCKFRGTEFKVSRYFEDVLELNDKNRWLKQKRYAFKVALTKDFFEADMLKVLLYALLRTGNHPLLSKDPVTD